MKFLTVVGGSLPALVAVVSGLPKETSGMVKKIFQQQELFVEKQKSYRRRVSEVSDGALTILKPSSSNENLRRHRQLGQAECDVAFVNCLPDIGCLDCFAQMQLQDIDWTGVTPDTSCDDVIKILNDRGHCDQLGNGESAKIFCDTFTSCVIFQGFGNDDDDIVPQPGDEDFVNCTALTECDWPGMHKNWIGDGVCHDNLHGCYNTELCNWDGGDCCEDTCKEKKDGDDKTDKVECGHDGFACRDPKSKDCDSTFTAKCPKSDDDEDGKDIKCGDDEAKYRLIMYDSFGDGWDSTTVKITPKDSTKVVYEGGLKEGSLGTEYICLSKEPTCYNAKTGGGIWGVESSWEIKPMKEAPQLAGSGAPNDCDFNVAGDSCEKTCTGRPETDPTDDPDYKSFKELYECVEDKCLIQLGNCNSDPVCVECFKEDAPDYCFGVDAFVAVIDCSVCKCTDKKDDDFCAAKPAPGGVTPPEKKDEDVVQQCTAAETMAGTQAVYDYSLCSDVDSMAEMITEFDNNNFGNLDQFESCAHAFNDEENHGGHTALSCMQILYNSMTNPTIKDHPDAPKDAIMAMARHLYEDGENFCECSTKTSEATPLCPSFQKFKTLLYEAMDACKALDEVDCDAWGEFWKPCKDNLQEKFGKSDFSDSEQCDYAKYNCGGAGTFPAFRRLDCGDELEQEAWDYYKSFKSGCLKGDDGKPPTDVPKPTYAPNPTDAPKPTDAPAAKPTDAPAATPTEAPKPTDAPASAPSDAPKPTPKPYIPPDAGPTKPTVAPVPQPIQPEEPTPYIPSDQQDSSGEEKKSSHFFRNFFIFGVLAGGGYFVYKRRFDTFNFVQYRRRGAGAYNRMYGGERGMYGGESEMYSNLNSSTTFEPPTLPPTPSMMMGTEMT